MIRFFDIRLGTALLCGLALSAAPPTSLAAQGPSHARRLEQPAWPRWESAFGTPDVPPPATVRQEPARVSDGRVLGFSVLGAAAGWTVGALLGAGMCYSGCGDDEWDALFAVVVMGVARGGIGSTLSGCSVAGESRCTRRVLPKALLGSVAAAAASVAVVSTTENGLSGLVTFSLLQGLLTTMTIR